MKEIFCTIGPSSLNKNFLNGINGSKVSVIRINLSHTKLKNLKKNIAFLKKLGIKNICIDTEGAQVRTSIVKKRFYCLKQLKQYKQQ